MSEVDYWTGFRDGLEAVRGSPSKLEFLLSGAIEKIKASKWGPSVLTYIVIDNFVDPETKEWKLVGERLRLNPEAESTQLLLREYRISKLREEPRSGGQQR